MVDVVEHKFGIKEYKYQHEFVEYDKQIIVNYLDDKFYNVNNINPDYPGYQTPKNANLFHINLKQFKKLKNTCIESVLDYMNEEYLKFRIKNNNYSSSCWCYMNWKNSDKPEQPFHIHNKHNLESLTGIFYLKLPKRTNNDYNCETQFYIGGNRFNLPSIESSWFIFPSNYGHKPGKQENDKKRYVISADIYFK